MKVEQKYYNTEVEFESADWSLGIARKAIDYIKTIEGKRYNPNTRRWSFKTNFLHTEMLMKIEEDFKKNDEPDFDINSWLGQFNETSTTTTNSIGKG